MHPRGHPHTTYQHQDTTLIIQLKAITPCMVVTPTTKTLNRCARHRIPNFRPPPLIRACRIVAHLSCQKGMATPLAVPPCGGSAEGHAAVEDNVKETVDTHEFPDVEQSGSHATTATTTYSSVQADTILNSFLEVPYARSVQAVPQHSLPRSKHTAACAAWSRCVLLSLRGVCQPSFLSPVTTLATCPLAIV